MSTTNNFDETTVQTIDLLEARLMRVEYAITGSTGRAKTDTSNASVTQRLLGLEHSLHQLAVKFTTVHELLRLHSRYPDLFESIKPDDLPTTLDTASIVEIVMASASLYSETASRLNSVIDVPIPPAKYSAQLIELHPRIARIEAIQALQDAEISKLRERSAVLTQKWYTANVLRAGEDWADLEGRVVHAEQRVHRASLAQKIGAMPS